MCVFAHLQYRWLTWERSQIAKTCKLYICIDKRRKDSLGIYAAAEGEALSEILALSAYNLEGL
jgi:hypothetical protein